MLYSTRSVQCSFFLFNLFSRWRHRCVKRKNTCSACCVRNVAGGESLRPKLANSGELAATPAHPHPAVLLDHLPLFRKTGKQVTASDIMWQLMIFGWHHKASGIRGVLYVTSMASDELIWREMKKKAALLLQDFWCLLDQFFQHSEQNLFACQKTPIGKK